jgi:hypothetical protein
MQRQDGEQRPWLRTAQRHGVSIVGGLDQPQKTDLHWQPSLHASLPRLAATPQQRRAGTRPALAGHVRLAERFVGGNYSLGSA